MSETVVQANKYMDQFKKEYSAPNQTASEIKPIRSKIKTAMSEIKESSGKEIENCNKALEQLTKLITIRATTEAAVTSLADKRPKRGRDSSVTSTAQTQAGPTSSHPTAASTAASNSNGLTVVLPPRGTSSQVLKARIQAQLPLQPGRKVAFRTPTAGKSSTPPTGEGNGYEEGAWILAVVKKADKVGGKDYRYTVQDIESEDGLEPPTYTSINIKSLIPLPLASDPLDSPSHLNAYPDYPRGTLVLALYPDTTSFYKATVVASPKEIQVAGSRTAPSAAKAVPSYKVRFEDDQDLERIISAEEVIDFPGY